MLCPFYSPSDWFSTKNPADTGITLDKQETRHSLTSGDRFFSSRSSFVVPQFINNTFDKYHFFLDWNDKDFKMGGGDLVSTRCCIHDRRLFHRLETDHTKLHLECGCLKKFFWLLATTLVTSSAKTYYELFWATIKFCNTHVLNLRFSRYFNSYY